MRARGHRIRSSRGEPRDSQCSRINDEFPGRRISPHRLRDGFREEIQVEAPRSRSGRRPQRAQNVCTQLVFASIDDCEWEIAPPRRCNPTRSWLLRAWMRLSFDYLKIKGRSSFEWLSLKRPHTYDRNVRKLGVAAKVFSDSALRAKMSIVRLRATVM
jgi:hypothetical protein